MEKTLKMAQLFRSRMTMEQIGEHYEVMRQRVQQRLASIGITGNARLLPHTLIDKECLKFLVVSQNL